MMSAKALASLLYALASAFGRLPWAWLYRLGDVVAWLWRRLDARENRVARRNLELALPMLAEGERHTLQRAVLRTTARQALETLRFWTRARPQNLALIREFAGVELFDAALASGRGVIVAAPHYGNWELLNQWLASRTPLAILYRPPESAVGNTHVSNVNCVVGFNCTASGTTTASLTPPRLNARPTCPSPNVAPFCIVP